MSTVTPLHDTLHARFRSAFGPPHAILDRDEQWSLKPGGTAHAIHVLVNGSVDSPAVWVFDPNASNDGVHKSSIAGEADIDAMINLVRERVARAKADHDGRPSR